MRPISKTLGIICKEGSVLLEQQNRKHSKGTGIFYRPLGGTIELGERSGDALIREFKEEIGADIEIDCYLGCVESIFRVDDQTGHEIILLYAASFKDPLLYEVEMFPVTEPGKETVAIWVPLEELGIETCIVYPEETKEKIKEYIKKG
ncbi:NUDIX domain-containing protein [Jeotgalibacillus sp. ET6]|uniref:NUDIX hydrolase n=1 Tax=Jeotgalibacillus sp. ET6 TaxID=3037260 RepID=UPI0024189A84|nr:NUDIX domain-containing protein [Jeotgalibacillus sp. ET6]MDG5472257.1 NUDIX domain-containing protein [Jeotgalibacillus sp. ET6]